MSQIDQDLVASIKSIIFTARRSVSLKINHELVLTYWRIGKEIIDAENRNNIDNQTSRQIILNLSKLLTTELGRGFSRSNLFNMRKFYLEYTDVQSLTGQLSWTHICELLIIEDKSKRSFYEKETINSNCNKQLMQSPNIFALNRNADRLNFGFNRLQESSAILEQK